MTSILFVRKPHVYLPEITAYRAYLAQRHPKVECFESTDMTDYNPDEYDILWHFMGVDVKGQGAYVVHEYNSLSTRPCARTKNLIKRTINKKPNKRIFLNERVRSDFAFHDDVPSHIRDMGIDEAFFSVPAQKPAYDFIYVGGLNRGPLITRVLDRFTRPLADATVLLVGDAPEDMQARYQSHKNIIFQGRVDYKDVPALLGQARYGLNIMPDIYPFNVQTSTKVLEYCAVGLPVVSTDYEWINQFEAANNASFYKLSDDLGNLDMALIDAYDFQIPSVGHLKWPTVIGESGIFNFLD